MPIGSEKQLIMGASGAGGGNYFGDGSDGTLTTSGNVTYTVANKSGSYDGDMYVANYTGLTIASGHTITVDQGCRGLLIYVDGNVSISGTLSMKGKGGHCDPTASGGSDTSAVNTNGLQLGLLKEGASDTLAAATFAGAGNAAVAAVSNQPAIDGDGVKVSMIKLGSTGGGGGSTNCGNCGASGSAGTAGTTGAVAISTGGGGGGGAWGGGSPASGGSGGQGGVFSGGAGGGGKSWSGSAAGGGNYGGAGGGGGANNQNQAGAHGGAGNPGGAGVGNGGSYGGTGGQPGQTGCGGILWLIVSGDVTVNSGGLITAGGMNSGAGSAHRTPGGGGSGAGSIMILQAGTYTNNGTVEAPGGTANTYGGAGGAGGIYQTQIGE